MDMTKVHTSGNDIRVDVGFTKIDEERREVSGFATTGKVDAHGEIVDPDGSLEAFKNFRGSIREMHQNNAVGVLAKFSDAQVFDSQDGEFYRGVMVSAKISKGAQDTWEKILDGTLKGFSIGGVIKERGFTMVNGEKVPVIKKYDLKELSVVDSPSNDASTFMSIFKTEDTGRVQPYKIYYQKETGNIVLSDEDDMEGFEQIGWTGDPADVDIEEITSSKSEPVAKQGSTREIEEALRDLLLSDFAPEEFVYIVDFDESEGWTVYETDEGKFKVDTNFEDGVAFTGEPAEVRVEYNYIERNQGADMETETTEKAEPATNKEATVADAEAVDDTEEAVADDHADEVADDAETAKSEDTEAVEDDDEVAKSDDDEETTKSDDAAEEQDDEVAKSEETDTDETAKSEDEPETAKSVSGELLEAVAALVKSVESMAETVEDVKENSNDTSEQIEEIAERVAAIEKSGAIKKSTETATNTNDEDENFWKGSALSDIRKFVNNK